MKITNFSATCLTLSILLSGCATNAPLSNQLVPESITISPPKPSAPSSETASQRDVATYIVLLRAWGDQMALQLNTIHALVTPKEKETK